MNLLPYMHEITEEIVGVQYCPRCNEEDLFFAFEGQCMECNEPTIKPHSRVDTFLYSLNVIYEFIDKYDELMPPMHKSIILHEIGKDINTIRATRILPASDRIKKINQFFKIGGYFGSRTYGASITFNTGENGKPSLNFDWEMPDSLERIKSISAVSCALITISKY